MATSPVANANPLPFIHPEDMPDVYALTGVGTCREPLLQDGGVIAFDKRQPPVPGDIVGLIFTRDVALRRGQPGALKRLVMAPPPAGFDGLVVVEQINPHRVYTFATTDLLAVHKCVGRVQKLADGSTVYRPADGGIR